ncbi:MAG TPA: triose-phosphate isomerase [Elusimicrobia bacterium]|nr:triose-phosphate isomerase [Elusimicrobiota bacterium]
MKGVKMSKRVSLIAGNWKMNKTVEESVELVNALKQKLSDGSVEKGREVLVCPPFTSLVVIKEIVKNSVIKLGAQNMYFEKSGAYTGEISPLMLKSAGCEYVIIGHSERRQYFGETDESVNKKMKVAFENSIIPIVCVGETLQQREKNEAFPVIEKQVKIGVAGLSAEQSKKLVIAYEPVWAIGTGKTATPEQAEEVHAFIRKLYSEMYGKDAAESVRILYGGSVKTDNVSEIMKQPDIDGALVGGASLKADDFIKLVRY